MAKQKANQQSHIGITSLHGSGMGILPGVINALLMSVWLTLSVCPASVAWAAYKPRWSCCHYNTIHTSFPQWAVKGES